MRESGKIDSEAWIGVEPPNLWNEAVSRAAELELGGDAPEASKPSVAC